MCIRDRLKGWETVEKAYEEHSVVEGIIVEENRGGVVATAYGVRVFIPASQTGIPKDQPMSQLVKTKQSFYITEINRQRKRVVGSIRQIQQEARKAAAEQIWSTIEVGNEYEGTVKSQMCIRDRSGVRGGAQRTHPDRGYPE